MATAYLTTNPSSALAGGLQDRKRANALPPSLRARVMRRAWEMFRKSYDYPRVPFRSIGRACFIACLRCAWHEAREIVQLASYGVERLTNLKLAASEPPHVTGITTRFWEDPKQYLARANAVRMYDAALALAGAR